MKRKFFYMAVIFMAILYSCKKDKGDITTNTTSTALNLSPDNTSVTALQFVILRANKPLSLNSYSNCTFNGQPVAVVAIDSAISFQVPLLSAGKYTFTASIDNSTFNVDYKVTAAPTIPDPVAYVNNYLAGQAQFNVQSDSLTRLIQGFKDTTKFGADMANINKEYSAAIQKFQSLSSADKMIAAQTLAANSAMDNEINSAMQTIFNSFNSLKLHKTIFYDEDRYREAFTTCKIANALIMRDMAGIVAFAATGGMLTGALTIGAGIGPGLAAGAVLGVMKYRKDFVNILKANWVCYIASIDGQFQGLNKKTSIYTFANNSATNFTVTFAFNSLTNNDEGISESIVSEFIADSKSFMSKFNTLNSWLGSYGFQSQPVDITTLTSPLNSQTRSVDANFLSVSNISNPNVSFNGISEAGSKVAFIFSTSQSTDQDFSFDLTYENPGISKYTTTIQATLTAQGSDSMVYFLTGGSSKVWRFDPSYLVAFCTNHYGNETGFADDRWTFNSDMTCSFDAGSIAGGDSFSCYENLGKRTSNFKLVTMNGKKYMIRTQGTAGDTGEIININENTAEFKSSAWTRISGNGVIHLLKL